MVVNGGSGSCIFCDMRDELRTDKSSIMHAQFFTTTGKRVFNVYVQNSLTLGGLDLVKDAGFQTAFVHEETVNANNAIEIRLETVTQNPFISAIEVLQTGAQPPPTAVPPPPPSPVPSPPSPPSGSNDVRLNIGGSEWVDPSGNTWKADSLTFGKAKGIDCQQTPIDGTTLDTLYCSYRWFSTANSGASPYVFTVPVNNAGDYRVRLHFAETVSPFVLSWQPSFLN